MGAAWCRGSLVSTTVLLVSKFQGAVFDTVLTTCLLNKITLTDKKWGTKGGRADKTDDEDLAFKRMVAKVSKIGLSEPSVNRSSLIDRLESNGSYPRRFGNSLRTRPDREFGVAPGG